MSRAENDIQKLFDGITAMKGWVIAGMGSLVMAGIAFVGNVLIQNVGNK